MQLTVTVDELALYLGPQVSPRRYGFIARPASTTPVSVTPAVYLELAGTFDLDVACTYRRGTPDVHTLPNGDPGYPGDPTELEIHGITCKHVLILTADGITTTVAPGTDVAWMFSDAGIEALEPMLCRLAEDQLADDAGEAQIDAYLAAQDLY